MDAIQRSILTSCKKSGLKKLAKKPSISNELSELLVYCQAVAFNPDFWLQDPRECFYEMCSFSETKHEKYLERGLKLFNIRHLSRVYPHGGRVTSSNFNPLPMWNSGCQMVALNFQTGDRSMQLNIAKFATNGRVGYVLKPQYLMDDCFQTKKGFRGNDGIEPINISSRELSTKNQPLTFSLKIIAGRHLIRSKKPDKSICSPFIEIEISGAPCDFLNFRTRTITSNGLNPVWEEEFKFRVEFPELAYIRFVAMDGDFLGPKIDPFLGQATFTLDSVRAGYRSVPLLNQFSAPLEMSALLIYLEIRSINDSLVRDVHKYLNSGRFREANSNINNP